VRGSFWSAPCATIAFTTSKPGQPRSVTRDWPWSKNIIHHKTAIFRQVSQDCPHVHHDALEFPDGEIALLTYLMEGQQATVLQLPATAVVSKVPQPLIYVLHPPMSQ
jgi:hypothetical protein